MQRPAQAASRRGPLTSQPFRPTAVGTTDAYFFSTMMRAVVETPPIATRTM